MGLGGGKVALVNGTTALSGACPTGAAIQDLVGWGGSGTPPVPANCFEGTAPAPTTTNTTSIVRAAGGCTDSNNNSSDFAATSSANGGNVMTPNNSATTPVGCACN
jgi:hypothetical protein